jgi:hypothetical protein
MSRTTQGNYINTDERDNTKVAQKESGENGTEKKKRVGGML